MDRQKEVIDSDDDPMDYDLDVVPPIRCKGQGCTEMYLCTGPYPLTPRQVIAQVTRYGWSHKRLAGIKTLFFCADCTKGELDVS